MRVGVLALQGCVDPHLRHIAKLSAQGFKVRSAKELQKVDRIILPGGESTTMLKLLHTSGLFSELIKFAQTKPVWGICAGAILIAKAVANPSQESLDLINIRAERNYYGSQLDSFEAEIKIEPLSKIIRAQFIRAPLLSALSDKVKVLATYNDSEVLFSEGRIMASAFHTELGEDSSLHQYFLGI